MASVLICDFAAGFGSGSGAAAAAAEIAVTGAALSRGHLKSSARPTGADTGSPLTSTLAAMASLCTGRLSLPPASSSLFPVETVNGSTGPASGRTADFASGSGPTGPVGSATGNARLFM